jgi:protein-tyrosine phosphatase
MKVDVYWIIGGSKPLLGIMPRPRGGDWLEDEINSLGTQGVDVLVSLLTPVEVEELGLADEAAACRRLGIQFHSFPISDRSVPDSTPAALEFVRMLGQLLVDGKTVVIHCRAGIGRFSMIAAAVLIWKGATPTSALGQIASARGCPVPDTAEQFEWVRHLFGADSRS